MQFVLFFICAVLVAPFGTAQTVVPDNRVGTSLSSLAMGVYGLNYERTLWGPFSVKAEADYSPSYYWYKELSFYALKAEVRIYHGMLFSDLPGFLRGPGTQGLFLALGGGYLSMKADYTDSSGISYTSTQAVFEYWVKYGAKVFIVPQWYLEGFLGYESLINKKGWTWKYDGIGYDLGVSPTYIPGGVLWGLETGWAF